MSPVAKARRRNGRGPPPEGSGSGRRRLQTHRARRPRHRETIGDRRNTQVRGGEDAKSQPHAEKGHDRVGAEKGADGAAHRVPPIQARQPAAVLLANRGHGAGEGGSGRAHQERRQQEHADPQREAGQHPSRRQLARRGRRDPSVELSVEREEPGEEDRVQADTRLRQRIQPEGPIASLGPQTARGRARRHAEHEGHEHRARRVRRGPDDQLDVTPEEDLIGDGTKAGGHEEEAERTRSIAQGGRRRASDHQ